MKISVTTYSFHDYINDDKLGYLGVIDKAAEMGFDGIEYTNGSWMDIPEAPEKIRERAAEKGIEVVALCVGADFINGCNGDTKAEIARVEGCVDIAAKMGAKRMRHDITGGFPSAKKICRSYDDALKVVAPAVYEVAAYAEQKGVGTMTENHGRFSQDALRVEKLINTVAHPNFGALVDIGNFMCADEEPTKSVGIMAPYAVHVHAKDFFYKSGMEIDPGRGWFRTRAGNYLRGAIIGQGVANAYQSVQILRGVGYDGYLTVEFEGMEDPLVGIAIGRENLLRFLK